MFLLVLLLFFVTAMAAKAQGKENTEIMGKKNLGSLLALYPKPMTVVGTEVNGKVNWLSWDIPASSDTTASWCR